MNAKSPSTSKHTPGPWEIYDMGSSTPHIGTVSPNPKAGWQYETVCNLFEDVADNYDTDNDYRTFGNAEANARLIASAPELYTAAHAAYGPLHMAALVCGSHGLAGTEEALEQIASALEAACAKAEGRHV